MTDFWTDERIATMKRLARAGLSASEIGAEIGATRNAVLGKAHRLKLDCMRYTQAELDDRLAKARARDKAKKLRKRHRLAVARQVVCKPGTSKTSAIYRAKLPRVPEMSKGQLRAFLAQACANTAGARHGSV